MRTFEKIVCAEGFQNTILACLLDRFNNVMPDLHTFCHLVWNKIHNHWGLTTKTRVHCGRTVCSIDFISRILPLTNLKECFYYFAKWLTGKETLFFNTSYNRTKISSFFLSFLLQNVPCRRLPLEKKLRVQKWEKVRPWKARNRWNTSFSRLHHIWYPSKIRLEKSNIPHHHCLLNFVLW